MYHTINRTELRGGRHLVGIASLFNASARTYHARVMQGLCKWGVRPPVKGNSARQRVAPLLDRGKDKTPGVAACSAAMRFLFPAVHRLLNVNGNRERCPPLSRLQTV